MEQELVETVNNTINHMMYINNMTTNTDYEMSSLETVKCCHMKFDYNNTAQYSAVQMYAL